MLLKLVNLEVFIHALFTLSNIKIMHTVAEGAFFEGYKFCEWTKKEVRGNYFHKSTLVSSLQSTIHVMIEFPLIFSKTYFVEVPKIHKNCSPQEKAPYIIASPSLFMCI